MSKEKLVEGHGVEGHMAAVNWLVDLGLPNKVIHYLKDDDGGVDLSRGELLSDLLERYAELMESRQQPQNKKDDECSSVPGCSVIGRCGKHYAMGEPEPSKE